MTLLENLEYNRNSAIELAKGSNFEVALTILINKIADDAKNQHEVVNQLINKS